MRRIITMSLELFCQVAIIVIMIGATISGANAGGFGGAITGFIAGSIFSVVAFGALFLLMDIADNTRKTVELLTNKSP